MQATIAIRDVFVSEGTTKKGQPFRLTKLYSTERRYYSTFKADLPKLQDVRKGSAVTLEYSNGDRPNTFSIIKILKVENRQSLAEQGKVFTDRSKGTAELESNKPTSPTITPITIEGFTMEQLGLTNPNTDMYLNNRLAAVKRKVARLYGIKEAEVDQKDGLVVELLAQMRSIEWQNKS